MRARPAVDAERGIAFVRVRDEAGRVRATLASPPDGGVGLFLHDPAGRQHARVGIPPGGVPEVVLFDESGSIIWQAP